MCYSFPSKEQVSFNFMAAVTIWSDFRAQEEEICHCFHLFPLNLDEVLGPNAMIVVLCFFFFLIFNLSQLFHSTPQQEDVWFLFTFCH